MSTNEKSLGIPWGMILFLLFLTLKLTGQIDWSWWWVTCPLWGPLAFCIVYPVGVAALLGAIMFSAEFIGKAWKEFRKGKP